MALVRGLAAVVGLFLIVAAGWSVIGTVVVPRRIRSRMTRGVALTLDAGFHFVADHFNSYEPRDRILAAQAPIQLILQIVVWLAAFELGFGLLLWPFVGAAGLGGAFAQAGSSLCTLGYLAPRNSAPEGLEDLAALVGLGTVALQIGYLPTLYAAFNRREALVTLLDSRAGVPSWGPELLARTHYGLGTGVSAVGELPTLFEEWERWSADVSESHTTYIALISFRSPRHLSSWLTAQLAVLDAAALYLSFDTGRSRRNIRSAVPTRWLHLPSRPLPEPVASTYPNSPIRTTASRSPLRSSSTPSTAYEEWTFHSSVRARRLGSTSLVGGSTTRRPPTPWPALSTLRRHCGRGLVGTPSQQSRHFGPRPFGLASRPCRLRNRKNGDTFTRCKR